MGFPHIELKQTISIICCGIFSLFFPLGLKEFWQHIKRSTPHIFPTGFLEEPLIKMMILDGQV